MGLATKMIPKTFQLLSPSSGGQIPEEYRHHKIQCNENVASSKFFSFVLMLKVLLPSKYHGTYSQTTLDKKRFQVLMKVSYICSPHPLLAMLWSILFPLFLLHLPDAHPVPHWSLAKILP